MALSTVCPLFCRPSLHALQLLRPSSIGIPSSPLFHGRWDSKTFFLCPLSIWALHHPALAYSGGNDGIETERLESGLLDDDLLRRIVGKKDAQQAIDIIAEAKTTVSGGTVGNDDCRRIIAAAIDERNVDLALSVFYAMLSGRSQGMNEVANLERWGWARPDVQTYVLLVRGLAACLRVADALRIVDLVSGAGAASGDEVSFGMIVQCPICMLAIAVAQPQHGVQLTSPPLQPATASSQQQARNELLQSKVLAEPWIGKQEHGDHHVELAHSSKGGAADYGLMYRVASCSKCRYQYELVSGDMQSIDSEVTRICYCRTQHGYFSLGKGFEIRTSKKRQHSCCHTLHCGAHAFWNSLHK